MGCTTSQQVWHDNHRDMMAMYNKRLGRHNDKTHIDTDGEDLQQLLGDEGFSDVWHPFIPVEMTDYTDTEIGKFLFFRFLLSCTWQNIIFRTYSTIFLQIGNNKWQSTISPSSRNDQNVI